MDALEADFLSHLADFGAHQQQARANPQQVQRPVENGNKTRSQQLSPASVFDLLQQLDLHDLELVRTSLLRDSATLSSSSASAPTSAPTSSSDTQATVHLKSANVAFDGAAVRRRASITDARIISDIVANHILKARLRFKLNGGDSRPLAALADEESIDVDPFASLREVGEPPEFRSAAQSNGKSAFLSASDRTVAPTVVAAANGTATNGGLDYLHAVTVSGSNDAEGSSQSSNREASLSPGSIGAGVESSTLGLSMNHVEPHPSLNPSFGVDSASQPDAAAASAATASDAGSESEPWRWDYILGAWMPNSDGGASEVFPTRAKRKPIRLKARDFEASVEGKKRAFAQSPHIGLTPADMTYFDDYLLMLRFDYTMESIQRHDREVTNDWLADLFVGRRRTLGDPRIVALKQRVLVRREVRPSGPRVSDNRRPSARPHANGNANGNADASIERSAATNQAESDETLNSRQFVCRNYNIGKCSNPCRFGRRHVGSVDATPTADALSDAKNSTYYPETNGLLSDHPIDAVVKRTTRDSSRPTQVCRNFSRGLCVTPCKFGRLHIDETVQEEISGFKSQSAPRRSENKRSPSEIVCRNYIRGKCDTPCKFGRRHVVDDVGVDTSL